jgi:acyl-CoA thioesterase II
MGDLAADTAVEGGAGRYRAVLSSDWHIWSPNGGYLAVIALRAAAAETRLRRPASFYAQYLSAADYGPVDLAVETLRTTKRTAALRVTMTQLERPILIASVWIVDETLTGLTHDAAQMPDVPLPDALRSFDELQPEGWPWFPFWRNFEVRPTRFVERAQWQPGEPRARQWMRFRPRATFDDPFVDAGRSLVLLDTYTWPAAHAAHGPSPFIAPNVDLAVHFHRVAPTSDWLLGDGFAPVAAAGLIGCHTQVWTSDGTLLASGACQLLCRPNPAWPADGT